MLVMKRMILCCAASFAAEISKVNVARPKVCDFISLTWSKGMFVAHPPSSNMTNQWQQLRIL